MEYGIVYLLTNPVMPGLVKIGMTTQEDIDKRMKRKRSYVKNGDVFIFIGQSRRLMKLLHAEDGGMVMYVKRLEAGQNDNRIMVLTTTKTTRTTFLSLPAATVV